MEVCHRLRVLFPRRRMRRRLAMIGGFLLCTWLIWSDTALRTRFKISAQVEEIASKLKLSRNQQTLTSSTQSNVAPDHEAPEAGRVAVPPPRPDSDREPQLLAVSPSTTKTPSGTQKESQYSVEGSELYNLHLDHDPQTLRVAETTSATQLSALGSETPQITSETQHGSSMNPGLELYDLPDPQSPGVPGAQAFHGQRAPVESGTGVHTEDVVDQQLLQDLDIAAQIDAEAIASLKSTQSAGDMKSGSSSSQEASDTGSEPWEFEFRMKPTSSSTVQWARHLARGWLRTFWRVSDVRRWCKGTWFDRLLKHVLPKARVHAGIVCFSIVSFLVALMVAHWLVSEDVTKRHMIPGIPKDYPKCFVPKQCCPQHVCSTCGLLQVPDGEEMKACATE